MLTVPPQRTLCAVCQKPFVPGDTLHSTLQAAARNDCCDDCTAPPEEHTYWRTTKRASPTKKPSPASYDAKALALLREALQGGDAQEAYWLALHLNRRKKLRLAGEHTYEVVESGEQLLVAPTSSTTPPTELYNKLFADGA